MNLTEERYLTNQEFADLVGVPIATVRRWRYVGVGPEAIKVGRHVRYPVSAVEKWLAARKEVPDA